MIAPTEHYVSVLVLEHLPPQQGLRPILMAILLGVPMIVLEHLPPQQGLRPM